MGKADVHFDRLGDALIGAALGFGGSALARTAALVGPYAPVLGIFLLLGAVGCILGALCQIALALGLRQAMASGWGTEGHFERQYGQPYVPPAQSADIHECHCTHHMNQRARQSAAQPAEGQPAGEGESDA